MPKLGIDVADSLLYIAEQGAEVHLMDWRAIVLNAGSGGKEIKRLRAEVAKFREKEAMNSN